MAKVFTQVHGNHFNSNKIRGYLEDIKFFCEEEHSAKDKRGSVQSNLKSKLVYRI